MNIIFNIIVIFNNISVQFPHPCFGPNCFDAAVQNRVDQFGNVVDSSYDGTQVYNVLVHSFFGNMVRHLDGRKFVFEKYSWNIVCMV